MRFLCTLVAAASLAFAADWPRFRGDNGTGIAVGEFTWPTDLDKATAWKLKLPGVGHGSPIVVGGHVFVQVAKADGTAVSLVSVNKATGDIEWSKGLPTAPGKYHKKNSMASGTPCSDGEHVAAVFWDGAKLHLAVYDFAGKELWAKVLGSFTGDHGAGHSPMMVDGRVIVNFDQDGRAELLAFEAKSGEECWRTTRAGKRTSYTTPLVRTTAAGRTELVVGTSTALSGYDPATGHATWEYPLSWPQGKALRAVGQPICIGGGVAMTCGEGGEGRYMLCVTPQVKSAVKLTWDSRKGTPYVPAPVLVKGHLYWVGDDGLAACAEADTGKVSWSERLHGRGVSSSPVVLGAQILSIAEDGSSATFTASTTGLEKTRGPSFAEVVYATPAAADGRVYVRSVHHLWCVNAK